MARLRIKIKVSRKQTPFLKRLSDAISARGTGDDRVLLNRFVGIECERETREHLRKLHADPGRHKTATRLGAAPTEHYRRAALAVTSTATTRGAFVEIPIEFGLSRAFRRFDIKPKRSQYLTIPAHKDAYGRTAGELQGLRAITFGRKKEDNGDDENGDGEESASQGKQVRALVRKAGKGIEVVYWLVEFVTIPKDRTLLPPPARFASAAERGARRMVAELKRQFENKREDDE